MHPNHEPSSTPQDAKASVQDEQEPKDLQKGVLISAELFQSLLSTMNRLRDSVSMLQTQLSSVKYDLSTLRQNCGGSFTFFPKLPLELRRKVWYFAYRAPQLHILNERDASRSELNSVLKSCSEARKVGQSLELDYFVVGNRVEWPDRNRITGTIRNYINLNIDTFWMTSAGPHFGLPCNAVWVCGKCHRLWDIDGWQDTNCGQSCLGRVNYSNPWEIKRLAINFRDWVKVGVLPENPAGSLRGIWHLKVDELLFVVGDFEQFSRTRDVNFVAPSQPRASISNAFSQCEERDCTGCLKTWKWMEEELQGQMRDFKAMRAAEWEAARIELKERGIDFEPWSSDLEELFGWEIPKVRFVEVRTTSQKWVVIPAKEATNRTSRNEQEWVW